MAKDRYLDEFTDKIEEYESNIDKVMKKRILDRTFRKINKKWSLYKNIAAAILLVMVVLALLPNTPVNAFCQRLFSFIPGVGIIENSDQSVRIKSVLRRPVRITEGEEFVEIKAAYIVGHTLKVYIKTNAGTAGAKEFESVKEFKEYYSAKALRHIRLSTESRKISADHTVQSGPSYETGIYSIDAAFSLEEGYIDMQSFELEVEGFNKGIKFNMYPVESSIDPNHIGNMVLIGDIMVFANVQREGEVLEVLLSSVAPIQYRNMRFHTFEFEKEIFEDGVHVLDAQGNRYEADSRLKKQRSNSSNTFYFNIPQNKKELKLVIPHVLYNRGTDKKGIVINMPKPGQDFVINREIDLESSRIQIERVSIIQANDPMLSDEFKKFDCLRIDASAKAKVNTGKMVCRVIPEIQVPDGIFGFKSVSCSTACDLWSGNNQEGYSISCFESMDRANKIKLGFQVECAMTGRWEINLQ